MVTGVSNIMLNNNWVGYAVYKIFHEGLVCVLVRQLGFAVCLGDELFATKYLVGNELSSIRSMTFAVARWSFVLWFVVL